MESIKSRLQKCYTYDIALIDEENDSKTTRKRRKKHNKRKVKAKVDPFQNLETLVITQKVEVKEQKFKCIINVTNICEHKQKHTRNKDRIIPRCLRNHKGQRCQSTKQCKKNESFKPKSSKKSTLPNLGSLSPISISSSESKPWYEDISSDSFYSDDDDIDYLIKRTKERDRKLSQSFDEVIPFKVSTPKYLESISDADSILGRNSNMDISMDSTTTLLLEPILTQPRLYSPTNRTSPDGNKEENLVAAECKDSLRDENFASGNNNMAHIETRKYSPAIDVKTALEDPGGFQFLYNCHIKNEPYSPSESPLCCHGPEINPYQVQIKLEKSDPVPYKDIKPDKPNMSNLMASTIKLEENYEVIDVKPIMYSPYKYK